MNLASLPPELLHIIALSACEFVTEALSISMISRKFYEVIADGDVWKSLYIARFGVASLRSKDDCSYAIQFQQRFRSLLEFSREPLNFSLEHQEEEIRVDGFRFSPRLQHELCIVHVDRLWHERPKFVHAFVRPQLLSPEFFVVSSLLTKQQSNPVFEVEIVSNVRMEEDPQLRPIVPTPETKHVPEGLWIVRPPIVAIPEDFNDLEALNALFQSWIPNDEKKLPCVDSLFGVRAAVQLSRAHPRLDKSGLPFMDSLLLEKKEFQLDLTPLLVQKLRSYAIDGLLSSRKGLFFSSVVRFLLLVGRLLPCTSGSNPVAIWVGNPNDPPQMEGLRSRTKGYVRVWWIPAPPRRSFAVPITGFPAEFRETLSGEFFRRKFFYEFNHEGTWRCTDFSDPVPMREARVPNEFGEGILAISHEEFCLQLQPQMKQFEG